MPYTVPPQFQDDLDLVYYETRVPRSWIAAVCEMVGWNPTFESVNLGPQGVTTVRRFGIAGVWAHLPEVPYVVPGILGPSVGAGWFFPGSVVHEQMCPPVPGLSQTGCGYSGRWSQGACLDQFRPVLANMRLAAYILRDCASVIEALCGEVNSNAFLRWMLGCRYPLFEPITGDPICTVPPGTPNIFIQETEKIIAAQRIYSEIFSEPPFGAAPLSVSLSANRTVVGPGGSVTFQANVNGGSGGNVYLFDFGDGAIDQGTNPTASHVYQQVGTYSARVQVTDRLGEAAITDPLLITVEEGAPVGGGFPWWAIAGAAAIGGVALVAGARKNKRQQAQEIRQRAQALRQEANRRRSAGDQAGAAQLEQEAGRLEAEAQRLEAEANREDVERVQRQVRR